MPPITRIIQRTVAIGAATAGIIVLYVTISLLIIHWVRGLEFSFEHNGTDLTFASSDGAWHGEEDMLRGRYFEAVVVDFELYRMRAGDSDVQLLRTKPWKKPWKWAWWFDRSSSLKWRVPYRDANELPPPPDTLPRNLHSTPEEYSRARDKAQSYLQTLR